MSRIHDLRVAVQSRLTHRLIGLVQPRISDTPRTALECSDGLTLAGLDGPDDFVVAPLPDSDPSAARSFRQSLADRLLRLEAAAIVDEYRPSVGPDYVPTPQEDAEWSAILFEEEERAYDAWIDERARDRHAEAFAYSLPCETDGYAPGYWS